MKQGISENRRKARLTLLFLAAVFLGPMVVAVVIYYNDFRWRPAGRTEHGVLYQPARPLPDATIAVIGDGNVALRGKWTLLYFGAGDCEGICRGALAQGRQVRLALGRDRDRVQRLYVVTVGNADTTFLAKEHPGIGLIAAGPVANDLARAVGDRRAGDLFLADPLGNLVMRYPASTTLQGMHGDLQHLLSVSTIG
jgi:hypothetical protein